MEAAVANLIEPGEKILVGNTGIWGVRAAELASRYGGDFFSVHRTQNGRAEEETNLTSCKIASGDACSSINNFL